MTPLQQYTFSIFDRGNVLMTSTNSIHEKNYIYNSAVEANKTYFIFSITNLLGPVTNRLVNCARNSWPRSIFMLKEEETDVEDYQSKSASILWWRPHASFKWIRNSVCSLVPPKIIIFAEWHWENHCAIHRLVITSVQIKLLTYLIEVVPAPVFGWKDFKKRLNFAVENKFVRFLQAQQSLDQFSLMPILAEVLSLN